MNRLTGRYTEPRTARCEWLPLPLVAAATLAQAVCAQGDLLPSSQNVPVVAASSETKYPVTGIRLEYMGSIKGDAKAPPVASLLELEVPLVMDGDVLRAPRPGEAATKYRLSDFGPDEVRLDYSAVDAIAWTIAAPLMNGDPGYLCVSVFPDYKDIGLRAPHDDNRWDREAETYKYKELHFIAFVPEIVDVRLIAGQADDPKLAERRINPEKNAVHDYIRSHSPIQSGASLRKGPLDNFVERINRHPGRRVDLAVSAASEDPTQATLDYIVTERNPWLFYAQTSNTGTAATGEWRERFGILNNQVSGRDDILQIDYSTAGFKNSHAVLGSYSVRLGEQLRGQVNASWNTFEAPDLGVNNTNFEGDGWSAGGELAWNFLQRGPFFVDAIAGARYESSSITNATAGAEGSGDFLIPYVGVRAERVTQASTFFASISSEYSAHEDVENRDQLGRLSTDENSVAVRYEATTTAYLEPLISPDAWAGKTETGTRTLAHEVAFSLRGQWSPDRNVPTHETVIGGLSSVRGYPESFSAGDSSVIASAEYRFHLPRALPISEDRRQTFMGAPFRWRAWEPYGIADWDLIFRAFVDAGKTFNNDPLPTEVDRTLIGAGVGAELQFRSNFSVRVDLGIPLKSESNGDENIESGEPRLHVIGTVSF